MADHAYPVFFGQPDTPLTGLLLLAPEAHRRIAVVWMPDADRPTVTWPPADLRAEQITQALVDHGYASLRLDAPGWGNSVAAAFGPPAPNEPASALSDDTQIDALSLAINTLAEASACTGIVLVAPPGQTHTLQRLVSSHPLVCGWIQGQDDPDRPADFPDTGFETPPWTRCPLPDRPHLETRWSAPLSETVPVWVEWLDALNQTLPDGGGWPMPRPLDYAQWPLPPEDPQPHTASGRALREQFQPLQVGQDRLLAVLGESVPAVSAAAAPLLLLAGEDDEIGAEGVTWSRQWQAQGHRVLRVPVPLGCADQPGALADLLRQAPAAWSGTPGAPPRIVACGRLASALWQDLADDPAAQALHLVLIRPDLDRLLQGVALPPDDVLFGLIPVLNLPPGVQDQWPALGATALPQEPSPPPARSRWDTFMQRARQILRRSAGPAAQAPWPGQTPIAPAARPWLQRLHAQSALGPLPLAHEMTALFQRGVTSHWLMPAGQPGLLRWAWALSGQASLRVAEGQARVSALAGPTLESLNAAIRAQGAPG